MLEVLTRAGCFIAIIALGFLLKKIGLFKDNDYSVLSTIVLKITLPAAIITNVANKEIDLTMFAVTLLGFGFGLLYVGLGFFMNLRKSNEQRAFEILNLPGYNIGCFAMPFVQSFLGPVGVITASLFDIGNAFVCLGGSYSIAIMVKDGERFSFRRIIQTLLKSIPFILYVVMPLLCIAKIKIPNAILTFTGIVGNANPFMAMFIIGVGFKLTANRFQLGYIFKILSVRYLTAFILTLFIYFVLPFEGEIQKALILLVFAPIGALVPIFTVQLREDFGLSSAINSISIICSIIFMVLILGIVP